MASYLLDTNIISRILRRGPEGEELNQKLQILLRQDNVVLMSPVVFYEVVRGLYYAQAAGVGKPNKQMVFFGRLASCLEWCDLTRTTWDGGAKLWAQTRSAGRRRGNDADIDKDVLIAAQAQEHNAVVVTDNIRHFQYLGVKYETW